jgi:hypothetical protein
MPRAVGESDTVEGVADKNNRYVPGAYTVTMGPQQMGVSLGEFQCYHITIKGPPGSSFQVYVGNKFYDFVTNGDINSWDPNQPMKLVGGNTVYFYWNTHTGMVPTVTMFFEEMSPL